MKKRKKRKTNNTITQLKSNTKSNEYLNTEICPRYFCLSYWMHIAFSSQLKFMLFLIFRLRFCHNYIVVSPEIITLLKEIYYVLTVWCRSSDARCLKVWMSNNYTQRRRKDKQRYFKSDMIWIYFVIADWVGVQVKQTKHTFLRLFSENELV